MDFTALKTELVARGGAHLDTTRQGYFINAARMELDNLYLWPYRLTSASGAAPLTVSDLGVVEEVIDTANGNQLLQFETRQNLRDLYGSDLTTSGTPAYFYIDNGVIRTAPVGGTLTARYFKRTPTLSGGTDTPLAPSDYHLLYVDIAQRMMERDKGNHAAADEIQKQINQSVSAMVGDLIGQQVSNNPHGRLLWASEDW